MDFSHYKLFNRLFGFFPIPVLFALAFFLFSAPAGAVDVARIGVVDFQRILLESRAGKRAAEELRTKQAERARDLERRRKEIVELRKQLENIEFSGSREEHREKELELNIKLEGFSKADKKFNDELGDINASHTETIKRDIALIVEKMGKKGGYLLILDKLEVLYYPDTIDITEKLIKQYDRQYDGR